MIEHIIIAGSGGQGVMLLGKILAEAAMREGKFVTWLPSYGAEVRGGTSHSMVIISDAQIGSPFVERADSLIIMNAPSLEKFKGRLAYKGLLVINSSLAPRYANKNARLAQHPFTDIAIKLGNIKVANMAALGCFVAHKKIVGLKTISRIISDIAPKDKQYLIEINKKALEEGAKLI
ncbi:MAG: 2-oxoacid:acceptor oxidoreductase family protein [Candidatus Omnitrophota bacterium]